MSQRQAPKRRRERVLVLLLACAAAARVLLLATAFPFFTNIDEHRHVDAVLKYARGYLPSPGNDAYEPEMPLLLALYASPEYGLAPGLAPPPPAWERAPGELGLRVESNRRFLAARHNLEAAQPPLYYALAGAWLRLGEGIGLSGGALLYWVRALGAVGMFALVLLAHAALGQLRPDDALLRLGVPVLLVVFPQDAVSYVTRDALSPLLFAVGFFAVLRLAERPASHALAYAAAGIACAAAVLAKYASAGVLAVAAAGTAAAWLRRPADRRPGREVGRWILLWLGIALPLALWFARNELLFDDFLGTSSKVDRMGWGRRDLAAYFDHPLFTPSGIAVFLRELLPRFWRGQLAWHTEVLAHRGADLFYTASSLVLLLLALIRLARGRGGHRLLEGLSAVAVLASAGLLAALSPLYAYGERTNPSAALPFFVQGRLVSGALVPFLVLYLAGLRTATDALPRALREPLAWGFLALVVAVALVSEARLTAPIFASPYNWYHLPR